MAESSSIKDVVAWLEGFVNSFGFTRPGRDKSLGRDIVNVIIRGPDVGGQGGILGRAAQDCGPEGYWLDNAKVTKERKQKLDDHQEANRQTGQMLSYVGRYGHTTIEPQLVTLRYGTGQPPTMSAAPTGHLSDQDKKVTATQKA